MIATKPKILVMGGAGLVGGSVIPHLLDDSRVQVVVASRSPEKFEHSEIQVVHLDLDLKETLAPALTGIERVFMVTDESIEMLRQSKDFLIAARRAGVKHIVHLGASGDDDSSQNLAVWHQYVERYVEWSGFSFTHLRPEHFMQHLLNYEGEAFVRNGVIRHYVGNARLTWVDSEDVAAVAAACLLDPVRHGGQTYRLGYETRTLEEIAEIFTTTLGQHFVYEPRPPEEFFRNVLAAGLEPAYMKAIFENYVSLSLGNSPNQERVFDNFSGITGMLPRTIENFAATYQALFRY